MLREGVDAVLELVFPLRCAGCREPGSWFCGRCSGRLHSPRPTRCLACGRHSTVSPCPICPRPGPGADGLFALAYLRGTAREAMHRLKYQDRPQVARALVAAVLERQGELPARTRAALEGPASVVAVPMHAARRQERGYNQAEELAHSLAAGLGLPYATGLARVDASPSLVGRSGEERRLALARAFAWEGNVAPPARVLLVDDVTTTGSTLATCAGVLLAAGSECVNAVALMQG